MQKNALIPNIEKKKGVSEVDLEVIAVTWAKIGQNTLEIHRFPTSVAPSRNWATGPVPLERASKWHLESCIGMSELGHDVASNGHAMMK